MRPHDVELLNGQPASPNAAQVRAIAAIGPTARIDLDYAGQTLEAAVDRYRLAILNLSVARLVRRPLPPRARVPGAAALPAPSSVPRRPSRCKPALAPRVPDRKRMVPICLRESNHQPMFDLAWADSGAWEPGSQDQDH